MSGTPDTTIEATLHCVMDVQVLDFIILKLINDCLFQVAALYDLGVNHYAIRIVSSNDVYWICWTRDSLIFIVY